MVLTCSPHRDGGGTLHLPSPTHVHHVDHPSSAIAQLRRSLSRSPSKGPSFRLVTTKSTSPSPSSPLSPSPHSPSRRAHTVPSPSPLGVPYPSTAKKTRHSLIRRSSPMRTPGSLVRSPAKRALSEASDNGNATPPSSSESQSGVENEENEFMAAKQVSGSAVLTATSRAPDGFLNPNRAFGRREKNDYLNDIAAKSSPLKRSDGSRNLDLAHGGSPSAKRRSLHGASSFGPDFDIFDQFSAYDTPSTPSNDFSGSLESPSFPHSPLPKRSSSLRKSTIQQRHDKPAARPRPEFATFPDLSTPGHGRAKPRMSLDNIQPPHDSPFSSQGALPSASAHPMRRGPALPAAPMFPQRHPLSRTLTQSSSSSSLAEDSPTHIPAKQPEFKRPNVFAKSLPLGANRPMAKGLPVDESSQESGSFSTPESYKLARPLPAAFMSTGLISKRNKNLDNAQLDLNESIGHMPDTPCKRPVSLATMSPYARPEVSVHKPKASRHTLHSFGTPSTPFNPHVSGQSYGANQSTNIFGSTFNHTRRGSFLSDSEETSQSNNVQSQSSNELDIPPTPTKQPISGQQSLFGHSLHRSNGSFGFRASINDGSVDISPEAIKNTSPLLNRTDPKSPKTPSDTMLPPDPSGLSISARTDAIHQPLNFASSLHSQPPATPTANRDSFPRFGGHKASVTPVHQTAAADVDSSLTSRFGKVEFVGLGEFSQVFRVSHKKNSNSTQGFGSSFRSSVMSSTTENVWAVKKSRQPYLGPRDRIRKLQEAEILKSLGNAEHTVQFFDCWEHDDRLYIQTEFCEEGSLDLFLNQVGRKARLDDFRIWKIMLELSEGLKHIHDSQIIHLDLKPANILITFEGTLKIGDFGMATTWPAAAGIEGEGDREYIGPEILMGKYDKPADVFALGLIMLEIAGNVMLPENGISWQRLRSGDMTDVPSLTSSSSVNSVNRDVSGKPLSEQSTPAKEQFPVQLLESTTGDMSDLDFLVQTGEQAKSARAQAMRAGELLSPPEYMMDPEHEEALDRIVRWMIQPRPEDRPVADQLLNTAGVIWVRGRRRAGATIYEGNWGPADEVLQDDAEMVDV